MAAVSAFGEEISGRDLDALGGRVMDAHRCIDSAGAIVDGKKACVEAWRQFFSSFPDYRDDFEDLEERGDDPGPGGHRRSVPGTSQRGRSLCTSTYAAMNGLLLAPG